MAAARIFKTHSQLICYKDTRIWSKIPMQNRANLRKPFSYAASFSRKKNSITCSHHYFFCPTL